MGGQLARWTSAFAAVLWGSLAGAQTSSLFAIPTQGRLPASPPISLGLHTRDSAALAKLMQLPAPSAAGRLDVELTAYRPLEVRTQRTWLESTFIVDVEERYTRDMYEEAMEATSERPTREQIVDFVAETVSGSLGRGWDAASTVAKTRTGDCTEYAVLVTALARAASRPARVVTGVVLVETSDGLATYGHAWAEVLEDGRWLVADAALVSATVVGYLPIGVLENEGPNFTIDLARFMQVWIQRVEVLGAHAATKS